MITGYIPTGNHFFKSIISIFKMLKHLNVLVRFYAFWLFLFFVDRFLFIIYYSAKLSENTWAENLAPFYHALRLDFSMAAYISLIPLLVYIVKWIFPKMPLNQFIPRVYTWIFIVIFAIISVANLNIYREWGAKFNYRAIDFAWNSPNEAMASSASSPIFSSLVILILLILAGFWLSKRIIKFKMPETNQHIVIIGLSASALCVFTFLLIRGGWQLAPINQSMSYFSQKPILNHASVNTYWNLMHDISKNISGKKNPYLYFKDEEARKLTAELYPQTQTSSPLILSKTRPNVVVIIMESFTADLVESLGGGRGIAPQMEKIIKDGVLFENIFASGDRTDKGTIAILSGFPSQAIRSIIKENGKQERLPALSQIFKQQAYRTSFYYGGESEFVGLKSYLLAHSYQKIIDKNDFDPKDMNSKWGTYDDKVFEKQLADLNQEKQPFFSTLLTLTNHEPFELPVKGKFSGNDNANKFRSTAFFADSCLGAYLTEARKQPWYKNTLFIIVADHGHRLPLEKWETWHPNRFRIPLIFFGDVIKPEYRGSRNAKFGSQTDIAKTLLAQMNMDSSGFKWSKDLLNPESKNFSFFDWDNGFGFATPTQIISFDNIGKAVVYRKNKVTQSDKALENSGKAYLQRVYQEYLNY